MLARAKAEQHRHQEDTEMRCQARNLDGQIRKLDVQGHRLGHPHVIETLDRRHRRPPCGWEAGLDGGRRLVVVGSAIVVARISEFWTTAGRPPAPGLYISCLKS